MSALTPSSDIGGAAAADGGETHGGKRVRAAVLVSFADASGAVLLSSGIVAEALPSANQSDGAVPA